MADESGVAPRVTQMGKRRRTGAEEGNASAVTFTYTSGALALDLVATAEEWDDGRVDLLQSPGLVAEWLAGPGLPIPVGGVTDDDLNQVRELRDAVDAIARALIGGVAPSADTVSRLNRAANRPTPVFFLDQTATTLVPVPVADLSATLSAVARDAAHLFAGTDRQRLRECERAGCRRLFCDRSPSGKRRWCAMKGCGELVASAAYRRRNNMEV